MQLTRMAITGRGARPGTIFGGAAAAFFATMTTASSPRSEVVQFNGGTSVYHEAAPYGSMTIINPSANLQARPFEAVSVNGGWQADVVSGASIKTRNAVRGNQQTPDAVSSASVKDFRQAVHGGFGLQRKLTSLDASYTYSWERDYRSHSFDVSAKAELLQRSMELSIAYARNWDSICDVVQFDNTPTSRISLDKSDGCFTSDPKRTTHDIDIDAVQAGWTQAWSPTFTTQTTIGAQVMSGFLSNPYREVNIGISIPVQEYHPSVRARYAAGLRANLYLRDLKTALRLGTRLYRDTWDVRAVTADLELERYLFDALRLRARGRVYAQQSAAFYTDDYPAAPGGGQYFTGDRELSTMQSVLAGVRAAYGPSAGDHKILGLLERVEISLGADVIWFHYSDFTVAGQPLAKTAIIGTLGLSLLF